MEFTDIKVLECNKQQSINAKDINGSNGIYTNKLGENITLQEGDVVNVEYAFINEVGCGGDTIEIEGKELGFTKEFIHIEDDTLGIYRGIDILNTGTTTPTYPTMPTLSREQVITHTKTNTPIMLRDDEINVVQYFYKTTNCENYHFLPRCFLMDALVNGHEAGYPAFDTLSSQPQTDEHLTANPITAGSQRVVRLDPASLCRDDYTELPFNSGQGLAGSGRYGFAPITDNAKFTILCKDNVLVDPTFTPVAPIVNQYKANQRITPAFRKYHLYGKLNTLKVDRGYNSPSNIATKITEQLQEQEETKYYYEADNGAIETQPRIVTTSVDTRTYKALNCACYNNFNKDTYEAWGNGMNTTPTENDVLYEQAYEFIGCKRPLLTIKGRECAENISHYVEVGSTDYSFIYSQGEAKLKKSIAKADANTSPLVTAWEYNDTNLKLLRNLFKEQGKYPELFNNLPEKFRTARENYKDNLGFLHTNQGSITMAYQIGSPLETLYQLFLGDDGMDSRQAPTKSIEGFVDLYSYPLFFHVDRSRLEIEDTGQSVNFLCYGFATKSELIDGKNWIVLHPELSGGLDEYIPAVGWVKDEQLIGWDCSFSAYSSLFIGLNSGYTQYQAGGITEGIYGFGASWNTPGDTGGTGVEDGPAPYYTKFATYTGNMISKTYIGATNSALSFLTNGHFGWEYLHEPERQGQPYDAGSVTATNPIKENASDEVYKINKLLNYWVFAPDYCPYMINTTYQYGGVSDGTSTGATIVSDEVSPVDPSATPPTGETSVSIKQLNVRIKEWSIMDAHGGLYMDLGNCYTEDTWNQGLLSILGFSYSQYNPKIINSTNNTQARITYSNIYNLEWATTNCQIVATESNNYIMNRYGGVQYTTQLPVSMFVLSWGRFLAPNQYNIKDTPWIYTYEEQTTSRFRPVTTALTIMPNIVETTTSLQITAEGLPKKMIKPYFTIRSDIITDNKYIGGNSTIGRGAGGGISLPVVAVVNKENGDGDFYFSVQSPLQFTITKPINLSCITTSIHKPDSSIANVDNGCCIVYKISRQRKRDPNIIQEIIGNLNKKK